MLKAIRKRLILVYIPSHPSALHAVARVPLPPRSVPLRRRGPERLQPATLAERTLGYGPALSRPERWVFLVKGMGTSSVPPASCSPKSSLWDEGDEVKSALFHSVEPEDLFSADVVHRSSRRHTQQRAQAAAESQGQGANVGRTALRPETGAMSRWPGVEYPKMQRSFSFRDSTEKYWKRKNS